MGNPRQPYVGPTVTAHGGQFLQAEALIPAGGSISPAIDLLTSRLNSIWIPPGWTAASLSFQSSPDGITFGEMNDDTGTAITIVVNAAQTFIVLKSPSMWLGTRYLKVRSGTVGSPVTQLADCNIILFSLP